MQPEVLGTSTSLPFEETYTLGKSVPAIPIIAAEDGSRRLGLITQLPEGAQIDVGGPGFNDRTIKVRCGGSSYFIFLEDLEPTRKHAAFAEIA
ncbi:MAG TPA: hypothetical protein VH601_20525 [Bryobacteraceae bacterium]|jgi:hypothetical protein